MGHGSEIRPERARGELRSRDPFGAKSPEVVGWRRGWELNPRGIDTYPSGPADRGEAPLVPQRCEDTLERDEIRHVAFTRDAILETQAQPMTSERPNRRYGVTSKSSSRRGVSASIICSTRQVCWRSRHVLRAPIESRDDTSSAAHSPARAVKRSPPSASRSASASGALVQLLAIATASFATTPLPGAVSFAS